MVRRAAKHQAPSAMAVRGSAQRGLFGALIACATLCGTVRIGRGDPTPSLALDPAPAGDRAFIVERAAAHGRLAPSLRVATDYANAPLVLKNGAEAIDRVVSHQMWVYAAASLSLAHRLVLHAVVPFVVAEGGDEPPVTGPTAPRATKGTAFGDARLGARYRIFETADDAAMKFDLALASSLWLPTANEGYAGDGAVRARGALLVEGSTSRVYWIVNGGVRTRPFEALTAVLPSRVGTAIALGAGAGFYADARQRLAIGVEIATDLTIGGATRLFDPRGTLGHALATAHFKPRGGPFEVGAALGPGFGSAPGSADFRALAMVGFAFEQAPPPSDEDGDGVPNKVDACSDLRGVPSEDPVLNGCPAAPIDRDGDGIPDENDACPGVAGESTRVKGTHGCPILPDADQDGVPDERDACPSEPGAAPPIGNGCPKAPEPPKTELGEQAIVLSQQVQFETGTAVLRAESSGVLGEVARILGQHAEIEVIEVQGHTDEVGSADYNRQLGQARAASVVNWLAEHGVAGARLTAKGYGSDRPIAENASEEGRQKNRRVEFRIVRRKSSDSQSGEPK
jgi:outer membrane protein OmpA-like peptidoglycan-associated protein